MTHPIHPESVESRLHEIEIDTVRLRKIMLEVVCPAGSPMFPLDFLAFAATKRHASATSAFVAMVRSWNMVVARALLRMHIDTSLRFSAAWHVAEPHQFATDVLKGGRIDKMKTRAGQRLTDSHLVHLHKEAYPWLPAVYAQLSGYVHFSGAHIADSIEAIGENERTVQFLISDQDQRFPEFSWIEILDCFSEASAILEKFLHGWGRTKKMSKAELSAVRSSI
jgi:hypothetical protein